MAAKKGTAPRKKRASSGRVENNAGRPSQSVATNLGPSGLRAKPSVLTESLSLELRSFHDRLNLVRLRATDDEDKRTVAEVQAIVVMLAYAEPKDIAALASSARKLDERNAPHVECDGRQVPWRRHHRATRFDHAALAAVTLDTPLDHIDDSATGPLSYERFVLNVFYGAAKSEIADHIAQRRANGTGIDQDAAALRRLMQKREARLLRTSGEAAPRRPQGQELVLLAARATGLPNARNLFGSVERKPRRKEPQRQ